MNHKVLTVKLGTGDIKTKQGFCDIQWHLEWLTSTDMDDMAGLLKKMIYIDPH